MSSSSVILKSAQKMTFALPCNIPNFRFGLFNFILFMLFIRFITLK